MHTRFLAAIVAGASLASASSPAHAESIEFLHVGRGSGTLGGQPFTNADFTIIAFGDTLARNQYGLSGEIFSINHLAASINLEGFGVVNFTSPTRTFVNISVATAGFSRGPNNDNDLYNGPTNPVFATWDMLSSIGPISGNMQFLQWTSSYPPVTTDHGVLIFNNGDSQGTFQAIVAPAPGTAALFGAVSLMGARRRRRARP